MPFFVYKVLIRAASAITFAMESVISAVCVIVAALIVYYAVNKPYRPKFSVGARRAPKSVVFAIAALSRECAVGERGHGVNCGAVLTALCKENKRLRKKCADGNALTDAEKILLGKIEYLSIAAERAVKVFDGSKGSPHVRGIPRVFLFCEKFTDMTQGSFSYDLLCRAVNEFVKAVAFDTKEYAMLPHAMRVCLIGKLLAIVERDRARQSEYERGVADGAFGRADLSAFCRPEYVSGLFCNDNADLNRLAEINGVSVKESRLSYKNDMSRDFSAACAIADAFGFVDRFAEEHLYLPVKETARQILKKNAARAIPNIVAFFSGVTLVALNASTARGAAAYVIGSALIAGAFLPVYAYRLYAYFFGKLGRKYSGKQIENLDREAFVSYFGGECDVKTNTLYALGSTVITDNRGGIRLSADGMGECAVGIEFECDGAKSRLIEFDGAAENHRTVYRLVTDIAEYIVETIAPTDGAVAALKTTVINRTCDVIRVSRTVFCAPVGMSPEADKLRRIRDGIAFVSCGAYDAAIYCDSAADFAVKNAECFVNAPASVSCKCETEIGAFSTGSIVFAVMLAACDAPLYNTFELMCDRYFECERYAALAFADFGGTDLKALPIVDKNAIYNDKTLFRGAKRSKMRFFDVLPAVCDRDGGILAVSPHSKNMIADGAFCAEISADGNSLESYKGERITGDSVWGLNAVTVAVGEDECVWSPSKETVAMFDRGCCTFLSGKNGCVTKLKRFMARGKSAEIFYLSVEDKTGNARSLDIMFSVAAGGMRVVKNGEKIFALRESGRRGFAIFSSQEIADYTQYSEGFFRRGVVDRTRGFMSGGVSTLPAVSVKLDLPPHGTGEVAFCLAVFDDGTKLDGISTERAFEFLKAEKDFYEQYSRITLCSTDERLNTAHKYLLYTAYTAFLRDKNSGNAENALIECLAAKYVDVTEVRGFLSELCRIQDGCGKFDCLQGNALRTALLFPLVVKDYVDHARDGLFLAEELPFKKVGEIKIGRATVLEHCLRAIDHAALAAVQAFAANREFHSAPLLYAAVRAFLPYLPVSARQRQYSKIISELRFSVVKSRRKIAAAKIEYDALGGATVLTRYALGDDDGGYDGIKELLGCGDKPPTEQAPLCDRIFSGDGVTAALAFVAVTEKLLGVKICGSRAKITPHTTLGTPHIEFELNYGDVSTGIAVDDTEELGSWQINVDKVTYATEWIKLSERQELPLIFRRSGNAVG